MDISEIGLITRKEYLNNRDYRLLSEKYDLEGVQEDE